MNFKESGLQFEFDSNNCYRIELCPAANALGDGIKKAEFLCLQNQNLVVLEAKSSIPQETKDPARYAEFWQEIYDKLQNSLQITFLGLAGRHNNVRDELPENFKTIDWSALNIQLVLVIPDVPDQHLSPMTDTLRQLFTPLFHRLWRIKPVDIMVLNRDMAQRKSLCE